MVWFFERGIEMAVLEVRRRETQFEVIVRRADGGEEAELVPTPNALFAKLEGVPNLLFGEGWRPVSNSSVVAFQTID